MCSAKLVVMAFCLVLVVTAQDDANSLEKRGGVKRYCGETLNAMLMFLCDSVYKRSGSAGKFCTSCMKLLTLSKSLVYLNYNLFRPLHFQTYIMFYILTSFYTHVSLVSFHVVTALLLIGSIDKCSLKSNIFISHTIDSFPNVLFLIISS